jgi:hypothetical protein
MPNLQKLKAKADKCGPSPDVPTAVLPLMVRARLGSSDAYQRLQGTIDYLTCLARAGRLFTADQKEFMHALFEAFSTGGIIVGMPEAARLADHYVNGRGAFLQLKPDVYRDSVIVRDASAAMVENIRASMGSLNSSSLATSDGRFMRSQQAKPLLRSNHQRSQQTQGALLESGALIAEQTNTRLKNADHRFILLAVATRQGPNRLNIQWAVESRYDFDPFSRGDYWTDIPLGAGRTLKVPDGLSEYISQPHIAVAKVFDHRASWTTTLTQTTPR